MARTVIQIEDALIESIKTTDPGIDARKGPLRGAFIQPQAEQLNVAEVIVDDLALRYSLRYVETRNPAILDLYTFNHGMLRGEGSPSKTTLLFFSFQAPPPGASVFIAAGTTIQTEDGTVSFSTTEDVEVSSSGFEVLFNSETRRYEIPVPAESVGIGPEFELAAKRLRTLTTSVEGIDGVEQPDPTGTSTEIEDNQSIGARQQAKFVGLAMGTGSGVESIIRDFDSARIEDVGLVYSTDTDLFRRPTRRPAFDVYIVGNESVIETEEFVASAGQTEFILSRQPVDEVAVVTNNGLEVIGTLFKDISPASAESTAATDKLVLGAAAQAGEIITVVYTYNGLLTEIQEFINQANRRLWQSSILIRAAYAASLRITVEVTALSTFDLDRIRQLTSQSIISFINQDLLGLTYFPSEVASLISATVAGLSSIKFTLFRRNDTFGVIPVDVVETRRNEFAIVSSPEVVVNVIQ